MKGATVFGAFLLAVLFASSIPASAATRDPARLVPWHLIGNAGLGMADTRIEYSYGQPIKRYADNGLDFRVYRGRGEIGVAYDRAHHVAWVSTVSPAYGTRDGFGVGSVIPLGPCHHLKGRCV